MSEEEKLTAAAGAFASIEHLVHIVLGVQGLPDVVVILCQVRVEDAVEPLVIVLNNSASLLDSEDVIFVVESLFVVRKIADDFTLL